VLADLDVNYGQGYYSPSRAAVGHRLTMVSEKLLRRSLAASSAPRTSRSCRGPATRGSPPCAQRIGHIESIADLEALIR